MVMLVIDPELVRKANASFYTISGLNHIRELQDRTGIYSEGLYGIWGEAYVDSNGRNNSVNTTDYGTTATFSSNKYIATQNTPIPSDGSPYVIFEASNYLGGIGGITMTKFYNYDLEKYMWVATAAGASIEIKRAVLYHNLFARTDLVSYFTSLTNIYTSVTRDVGKIPNYVTWEKNPFGGINDNYIVGTFTNTSTNTSSSFWAYVYASVNGTETATTFDTDQTSAERDNPADFRLRVYSTSVASPDERVDSYAYFPNGTVHVNIGRRNNGAQGGGVFALVMAAGGITYVETNPASFVSTKTSYFELKSTSDLVLQYETIIIHHVPTGLLPPTASQAIGVPMIAQWETGADIDYKLTNSTEDSGWLPAGIHPEVNSFERFTSEPTRLIVRLTPKTLSPTAGYPSIYGFAIKVT